MGRTTDIREAVEAELNFDPLVDDADIHVMNMNGDVALNGTVPSYPQYLEAAAAAQLLISSEEPGGLHLACDHDPAWRQAAAGKRMTT